MHIAAGEIHEGHLNMFSLGRGVDEVTCSL